MICNPCKAAADMGEQGEEAHKKRGCKGDCDCMHRTGPRETMFNPQTVKDMVDDELGQRGLLPAAEGQSTRTVE